MAKILIVDDEASLRSTMRRCLKGTHEVLDAGSMGDGMALLATSEVDAVLTDFTMPGGDGVEFARAVHATWPGARVLLVTAVLDNPKVNSALVEHVFDGILRKPWTLAELRASVAALLTPSPLPPH
jgi:response regulator RpfG family c-di-GMP phosphodiesterase